MFEAQEPYVDLLDKVETFQAELISQATGKGSDASRYANLRSELLQHPTLGRLVPRWVRTCRTPEQFWNFIQPKFQHYGERRQFIHSELLPLTKAAQQRSEVPADAMVAETLGALDPEHVREVWDRALQRRSEDPSGALTLARTLVESVCKHVLDELKVPYGDADLPKLYKLLAKSLSLHPDQHAHDAIKRILGSCASVVEGLGTLRNSAGDAHGQGRNRMRPSSRHAELAVNLAGAMAQFIVSTWQARVTTKTATEG